MGVRHDFSPIGLKHNWVTSVGGLPPMIRDVAHALLRSGHDESSAIRLAVGAVQNWASGQGKVHADTRARAAAAVAQWEAMKAASHAKSAVKESSKRDDMGVVTESGSAGALLPVGPYKAETAQIVHTMAPHGFRGRDLGRCAVCGEPVSHTMHSPAARNASGLRAPLDPKHAAHAATFEADATIIEHSIRPAVAQVFEDQKKATLSRLLGKRGKQMTRAASDGTDGTDGEQPANVDPAKIFDVAFWIQRLEQALQPSLSAVAPVARARVQAQLDQTGLDDASSLGALRTVLQERVGRLADEVNQTTYDALAQTLNEGIAAGEGTTQLAARVSHIFDTASQARATTIARTESVGALNQASHVYAKNLPSGIVGGKEWLAHHDSRTRPDHRLADGEKRTLDAPFEVGGFPMQFPGDPTGPPSEVINCRCSVAYIPASKVADQVLGVAA